MGDYGGESKLYQYLTAMNWSISNFQGNAAVPMGNSLHERAYAVGAVLVALIVLTFFVSNLTNELMQYTKLVSNGRAYHAAVDGFLSANRVSPGLAAKVKRYIGYKAN